MTRTICALAVLAALFLGCSAPLPKTGRNDPPLKTVVATRPENAVTLTLVCELSSDYSRLHYDDARTAFYSFYLIDPDPYEAVHGYAERKSDAGEKLYNLLKDGRQHVVTIDVRFDQQSRNAIHVVEVH